MTELDKLIKQALKNEGQQQEDVNKVYLALLRTVLFIPVEQALQPNSEEPFKPIFAKIDGNYFLAGFDEKERLQRWAGDKLDQINYVELLGREFIAGINENVYFCLNIGEQYYKEFSPDEVKRIKMIAARIEQLRNA